MLPFFAAVALRKESVDRNAPNPKTNATEKASLSARRAWIEISWHLDGVYIGLVALRKESVDRNLHTVQVIIIVMDVALRKESVDRNE